MATVAYTWRTVPTDPCLAKIETAVVLRRLLPLTSSPCRPPSTQDRVRRRAWLYGWLYTRLLTRDSGRL